MRIAREPDDIRADDPALVLAIEGCDFLEGDLDRLDAMEARGVRSIQLTHYLVNETGDIQTAPPVHGGLTPFGARRGAADERDRRHRRRGALLRGHREAASRAVATKPFLCTHANLKEPGHPRWRPSTVHQPGLRADGGGDRRRDRRLDRGAEARKSCRA